MDITLVEADYWNEQHCSDIIFLTNEYAKDDMGGAEPLPRHFLNQMIEGLRETPNAFTLLAYREAKAVGIATCFIGFSTFDAAKLINIHDLAVLCNERGKGIGEKLLQAIQKKARQLKCCKLTLEMREDNRARNLYERFGFENHQPKMEFLTKEFY